MAPRSVSIEEYLAASFEYDREWVDGILVERNGGEFEHSLATALLAAQICNQGAACRLICLVSVRLQIGPRCIRVPDLVAIRKGVARERIVMSTPLLVIEVRSWDDTFRQLESKCAEYAAFGVEHVWVIDPYARVAYRGTHKGLELVRSGELDIAGTPIRVSTGEIFAELDRV